MSRGRDALRVGIVGLGRWGQVLVRSVQPDTAEQTPLLRFSAGYTRSPEKIQAFAREHGIALFASYEELIRSNSIDAVVIASPHSQHVPQIVAAAAQGRHVFCEKPLALRLDQAEAAVAACRAADRTLAVGFNRRFLPAFRHLLQVVRSGTIGTLLHVEGNFSGPFGLGYKQGVWHADKSETPGGGMTLMGIHVLDAMIGVAGPISTAKARSRRQVLNVELDDTTDAQLEFESGCTGYLSTLTATARQWRLQVFGTEGWVQMIDQDRLLVSLVNREVEDLRFPAISTEKAELESFARSVLSGEAYPVSTDEVLNGLKTLEAILDSIRRDAM